MTVPIEKSGPGNWKQAGLVAVDGRTYPLDSVRIEARAEGGVACTTLSQVYRNPYDEPLEVLYTLPLPADGAVIAYAIRLGERLIRGEVRRREEAAEQYRKALTEGRTAALLEQDRDDTFQQRLGNLPGGQSAEVEIQLLQPLAFLPMDEGRPPRWEYRFPTVVGVRYEGAPGRVPDADRLDVDRSAGRSIPTRFAVDLTIADGPADSLAIGSTSHTIVSEACEAGARVRLGEEARLVRDLVLSWNACSAEVGVRITEGPGLAGDDGRYALVTVTPQRTPDRVLARDLTVLLDASGSMSGSPLGLAKAVVADLLESLEPGDRFEVLAFANQPQHLTAGLVEWSPRALERALDALRHLEAGGGTEMANAMVKALAPLREGSQRQVVLVTDGYIGFEPEVVGPILRQLPEGARVHVVGVGAAPNRTLTRGVARAGRGVEVFAGDDASALQAARRLRQATVRPVLTDLSLHGSAVRGAAPARARDVLAGQPFVLAVELEPEGGVLEIQGRLADSPERWVWRFDVQPAAEPAAGVFRTPIPFGAMYGREVIADLELRLAAGAELAERLHEEIEATALRHRIASRRTSLVAVAEEPSVDPREPRRREQLPLEMPAEMSAEGVGLFGGGHTGAFEINRLWLSETLFSGDFPPTALGKGFRRQGIVNAAEIVRWSPEALRRYQELSRIPASTSPTPAPSPTLSPSQETANAQLLRAGDRLVVIEFEVSRDGFSLPDVEMWVWFSGKVHGTAQRVPESSSPRGPHPRGTMVRLAMRMKKGSRWPQNGEIEVAWLDRGADEGRGVRFAFHFVIPRRSSP